MITNGLDFPIQTIRTKREEKLSSRCPTRQISMGNSSLEVYYGDSSLSIPFMWESQPGTPKIMFRENPLPPLTPPPSYHFNHSKKPIRKRYKSNLLHSVLPKLTPKKTNSPASPASSSSSPYSSHSTTSSPFSPYFDSGNEEDKYGSSPVSTLCFGITRGLKGRSLKGSSSTIAW